MKKLLMALSFLVVCLTGAAQDSNVDLDAYEVGDNSESFNQIEDSKKQNDAIMKKFGKKMGLRLIEGSLSELKGADVTINVVFDWTEAKSTRNDFQDDKGQQQGSNNSASLEECIAAFNEEIIEFYEKENKTGVKLAVDDEDATLKMVIKPLLFTYYQKFVLTSGSTTVNVAGLIEIVDTSNADVIAVMSFFRQKVISSNYSKSSMSYNKTVETWRDVAQQIDKDLIKAFKEGKLPKTSNFMEGMKAGFKNLF